MKLASDIREDAWTLHIRREKFRQEEHLEAYLCCVRLHSHGRWKATLSKSRAGAFRIRKLWVSANTKDEALVDSSRWAVRRRPQDGIAAGADIVINLASLCFTANGFALVE